MLGQNAAVGNAELDHQFFFVVVAHQCDVHETLPFLGGAKSLPRLLDMVVE